MDKNGNAAAEQNTECTNEQECIQQDGQPVISAQGIDPKIKAIFFDLDGTLSKMDQDGYTEQYCRMLGKLAAALGADPKAFVKALWHGIECIARNDGSKSNEEVFQEAVLEKTGFSIADNMDAFNQFYQEQFPVLQSFCPPMPKAAELVHSLQDQGMVLVLATNPIFPRLATEWRIQWTGLQPDDFELVTTYENSCYAKPNPAYYAWLAGQIGLKCDEVLMVGNDAREDLAARKAGMNVFLVTDCLLNPGKVDISQIPHGTMEDLAGFLLKKED